jgi:regulator of protease activity HflC (stomatin/prohibitin superfamily)
MIFLNGWRACAIQNNTQQLRLAIYYKPLFIGIQDINPSHTMQKAMEEQASSEGARLATVTRTDGEKEAAVLEADGRLEASRRDAKAKVVLAEANQLAIQKVAEAIGQNELPVTFLLGEKYVEAIKSMANSENLKTVLLPGDIPNTVRSLMGALKTKRFLTSEGWVELTKPNIWPTCCWVSFLNATLTISLLS